MKRRLAKNRVRYHNVSHISNCSITHTIKCSKAGRREEQRADWLDWKAYRLPGLKFNSRSYGRNPL